MQATLRALPRPSRTPLYLLARRERERLHGLLAALGVEVGQHVVTALYAGRPLPVLAVEYDRLLVQGSRGPFHLWPQEVREVVR